jgi:hypothetical protein
MFLISYPNNNLGGKIMPVFNQAPIFLFPKSTQFPFDDACKKIVRAIEKRNWKVPGLTVEFSTYGSGEAKYCYVTNIRGDEFKLHFSRVQGNLGRYYNNIAAVNEVTIPQQQICVYDDESGPAYYLYVGDDWNKDKDRFINGIKVHSKLDKKPKTYLRYEGRWNNGGLYRNRRPLYLVHDDD